MVAWRIEVSEEVDRLVRERASERGLTPDQYLRQVIETTVATDERDYWDDHPEELEALIEEGINSGPAEPWTHEDFERMRREIIERHANRDRQS